MKRPYNVYDNNLLYGIILFNDVKKTYSYLLMDWFEFTAMQKVDVLT